MFKLPNSAQLPPLRRWSACLGVGVLVLALGGCGLESAGTAATAGVTKQAELEQARKTQEQVRQQLQQSMEQINQRNQALDENKP